MSTSAEQMVVGLDDSNDSRTIQLISSDEKVFTIEKKYAFISILVKTSMENDASATNLPLPAVKGDVLAKVIEFMNHHKGVEPIIIEKPLRSKVMKDVCRDVWDAEFIDKVDDDDRQALYDLILAANYMDIKSLLYLGSAKVASLIKGAPLEKIQEILSAGNKK